jgi:tRNA dimethylallyltransferase
MTKVKHSPLLVILGPTASGKTALGGRIALVCRGEIISADSRQVYRGMNLGTGKDYEDYIVNGKKIPYHLIDIIPPGEKYNVFEYQKDFRNVYQEIIGRNSLPILCGGSGLYIDAVIHEYELVQVPLNPELRQTLADKNMDELSVILSNLKKLHNKSDIIERKRLIRAIEIATYQKVKGQPEEQGIALKTIIFGLQTELSLRRKKITDRLHFRLDAGMVDEVKHLLDAGISSEQLIYYGLEYKFITQYLSGIIKYEEMVRLLNIAIHQFAKRQMTWFRKMEKEGTVIHWLDSTQPAEKNLDIILSIIKKQPEFQKFITEKPQS